MEINPGSQGEHSHNTHRSARKWLAAASLIAGLLILGALVVWVPRQFFIQPAAAPTLAPTPAAPMDASPALGPANAPITIIEYADFGCPSCWYWYKVGVLKQLQDKYGDKIRFVWRDYPVITILSPKAAEAGQCANDQGKFWEFHNVVYDSEGAISANDLKTYATAIGLNMAQFNTCVSSRRYQERVNAEQHEAFSHGFNGAPFFLVNGHPLIGPPLLPAFLAVIDPLLASMK